jgi:ketosteroid isomerase-like protein
MNNQSDALGADDQFFACLRSGDAPSLNALLTDDFILVDVMSGAENPKASLLEMIGSGQLKFVSIEPFDRKVRIYGDAAVIIGRTRMKVRMGADEASASSRYTHVLVKANDRWRLASAQGTPVAET